MATVRMFCDWDNDSEDLIRRLREQTDGFDGNDYKGLHFVSDDSYTHAICFNFPTQHLLSDPKNNVALLLEPPELVKTMFANQYKKKYDNVRQIYSFAVDRYEQALGMGFATVPHLQYPSLLSKPKKIAMIVSDKLMTPYHQKRHQIKNALLATDLPIDFYGRGLVGDDPRIKGEIPSMAKYSILSEYQMCIDFENSPYCVVTDKFFDPVLCNTMPITNASVLHSFVDMDSFFFTSFDLPTQEIVLEIEDIIDTEIHEGNELALNQAKMEIRSGDLCLAEWIYQRVGETL